MKRKLLLGTVMAIVALLVFSCNKNRFELDHLESVEGSGQWKLPIGSAKVSLGQIFSQISDNEWVTYDENGNLQIAYSFMMDNIIKGSNFMTLGSYQFDADLSLHNDFYNQGVVINGLIDTTLVFKQKIEITTDSLNSIERLIIKKGVLSLEVSSNMFDIESCILSSPDIVVGNDTLAADIREVPLAGAVFSLNGGNDSIVLHYAIRCALDSTFLLQPDLLLNTHIELVDFEIKEISGHLDEFTYDFEMDTAFMLDLENIYGDLKLVDAKLKFSHKNTFGNLVTTLEIDPAEFYGGNAAPSPVFPAGFEPIELGPTDSTSFASTTETITIDLNTEHDRFRLAGFVDCNPGGVSNLISVYDYSSLGLGIDVRVPFKFNIPGVYYLDTLDIDLSKIDVSDFISEVILDVVFNSELPFNLNAQLYTLDSVTEQITDSLFVEKFAIGASFDGSPVQTVSEVSVTHGRLNSFFASKKVLLRANLNTDGLDVLFNLKNSLGVVLKADVIYGGSLEIN